MSDDSHDLKPIDPVTTDAREIEDFLCTATILDCKLVPWGSNYTFAVALHDPAGQHEDAIGIYKPRAGESPLWDFPGGTLYQREYAAFLVSRFLGWDFIPYTIIRDGPHGIGTVQLYVEPEERLDYATLRDAYRSDLMRMTVFDLVTNNADRKASHFFKGKSDGRIWGIDHGLTFHVHPKLRTVIWDFCGEPIEGEYLAALEKIRTDDSLPGLLRPHLDPLEIEALRSRAGRLAESAVFPFLSSRRNIPYGW